MAAQWPPLPCGVGLPTGNSWKQVRGITGAIFAADAEAETKAIGAVGTGSETITVSSTFMFFCVGYLTRYHANDLFISKTFFKK